MSYVKIALFLLSIVNRLSGLARAEKLMDAGKAQLIAQNLAEISQKLGISQQVREEVAKLSDEDLNAELRGD